MTYPQPDADQYAITGSSFFRLYTTLTTDGDIYESAQGAHAFAIGPESDIFKVNVNYFDDQVQRYMNQVGITPDRPFIGAISARNDTAYTPSKVPGRTLMWPDEIYNPDWSPPASYVEAAVNRVDFIAPVIDIIQYFSPAPITNGQRNNKNYHYDRLPLTGLNFYWLIIPYYGRRYASVYLANQSGQAISALDVFGLNYRPGTPNDGSSLGILKSIGQAAPINDGAAGSIIVKASANGMYDALAILVTPGNGHDSTDELLLDITVSDKEA